MDDKEKKELLKAAKEFFRENISKNHITNTEKLYQLKEFNVNPFLIKYLANYYAGSASAENMARVLIYPRVLGTSITTSFGTNFQKFIVDVLRKYGFASQTAGLDIEFVDQKDGRKKYCQLKSGPNNINKDDVPTIINHFKSIRNIARTNNLDIGIDDLIVCVVYGVPSELSAHFKKINETHQVYIGQEFWEKLTGDSEFYNELIEAFSEVAIEADGSALLEEIVKMLAADIEQVFGS